MNGTLVVFVKQLRTLGVAALANESTSDPPPGPGEREDLIGVQ
jgi:hypothetical protein